MGFFNNIKGTPINPLGNTITNVSSTVNSLSSVLSFTQIVGGTSNIPGITNAILPFNWRLSLPYSFKIIGLGSPILGANSPIGGLVNVIGQASDINLFGEFVLPINPQNLSQDEAFSIVVTPTQKGMIAEHNGIIFKDLVISGTFGQRATGNKSGYHYFHELRNYLRAYSHLKKDPTQKNLQLMFVNKKDNEWLIVEPMSFSLKRASSSPFLYNYQISLRVLGLRPPIYLGDILGGFFGDFGRIFGDALFLISQARVAFDTFKNLPSAIEQNFKDNILSPIGSIVLFNKSVTGQPYTLADLNDHVISNLSAPTVESYLNEAKQQKINGNVEFLSINFPQDIRSEAKNFGGNALKIIPIKALEQMQVTTLTENEKNIFVEEINKSLSLNKKFFEDLKQTNRKIWDNFSEKIQLGNNYYNSYIGRSDIYGGLTRNASGEDYKLLMAFQLLDNGLNMILSTEKPFKDTVNSYVFDVLKNYDDGMNISKPQSVDVIHLQPNTTLEDLAAQFLGSAEKWIDIAILNNLVYPYIDENPTDYRVKKPGDKILIPKNNTKENSNIPSTKDLPISEGMSATEKNLGIDIKLNKDFDFILNNNNDIELVAGGNNAGQAVVLKLGYEKGELKYHPTIGVGLSIGEKLRNGEDIREDLINTILSDSRFTGIKNMNLTIDGNSILINLDLYIKQISEPVNITLRV